MNAAAPPTSHRILVICRCGVRRHRFAVARAWRCGRVWLTTGGAVARRGRAPLETSDGSQAVQVRHHGPARGAAARSGDRRARRADLSDHLLRVHRCRSGSVTVQSGARRAHLFAHLQPDGRGSGGARRGARGRRRRGRHGERPGGLASRDRDADGRGRSHRIVQVAVRRQHQSAEADLAPLRHRDELRRSARSRRL